MRKSEDNYWKNIFKRRNAFTRVRKDAFIGGTEFVKIRKEKKRETLTFRQTSDHLFIQFLNLTVGNSLHKITYLLFRTILS